MQRRLNLNEIYFIVLYLYNINYIRYIHGIIML